MGYDRKKLGEILDSIPIGKVTTHGLIAKYLGTTSRAVARGVCASKGVGRLKVVMKGGYFPHPDNYEDCSDRARTLIAEGLEISNDKRRVVISEENLWKPYLLT